MISVKVLGAGCKKCETLTEKVKNVISGNKIEAEVEKVTDLDKMMDYGIMMTPALIINEEVKSVGKLPQDAQITSWLQEVK